MLAVLGDLLEDIIVRQREPMSPAADTAAEIARRPGGSASNVARVAARRGAAARFIGQVGEDDTGRALVEELRRAGVDTSPVRFSGTTGTVVVLVDERGKRTMFTDRRACLGLDRPDPRWLDRVDTLHVPFYSLADGPISETAARTIEWARDRGIRVSVDVSSESVIDAFGPVRVHGLLDRLAPDVVFANRDEARILGIEGPIASAVTVVKQGGDEAVIHSPDGPTLRVAARPIAEVRDTTGAGDAFAAGFLTSCGEEVGTSPAPAWRHDLVGAARAGHHAAADLISAR
jgi:sugar/nucleoside kinase (ribokinase family)